MNKDLQVALELVAQSAHLSDDEKKSISKSLKDADKELEITSLKLDSTEKVKKPTAILLQETIEELEQTRKAVEEKNHELEIQTALERVRAIALSMNKPADMLEVCRIISHQLASLGVKEIRNVQTAIFYENKGTYMNYEYYAKHDKTFITETSYTNHAIHRDFAEKMLKGNGEFMIAHINGSEVKDWIAYQKTTNVFIDTYLETASSLNYYWFSLGPVALGISTYLPLREDDIHLFKRFLKVFELAYRRYLDIEMALTQAREAQIEASLERLRAAVMAMHRSEELTEVCEAMFKELTTLGFSNIRNAQVAIENNEKKTYKIYVYSPFERITGGEFGIDSSPITKSLYKLLGNSPDGFYEKQFSEKEMEEWRAWRKTIAPLNDPREETVASLCWYMYGVGKGHIGISTFDPIGKEEIEIVKRFKNVFALSYRRFDDLQKAEAQTREAQIQLALERVRARTMAMQKSNELAETVSLLFKQLIDLGIKATQMRTCAITTLQPDEPVGECWITTPDGNIVPESFTVPYNETSAYKTIYSAWKNGEKFLVVHLSGDELAQHLSFLKKYAKIPTQQFQAIPNQPNETFTHAMFFLRGYLFIISNEPLPQYHEIFKRFGNVFEQTYTRFLDLKNAEAQARESQIQLALERVRASTMAMQKSEELSDTVFILFQQFKELGENPDQATIGIINEEEWVIEYWVTMYGNQTNRVYKFSIDEPNVTNRIYNAWKEQKKSLVIELGGKALYDFAHFRESMGGAAFNPEEKKRVINVAFFSKGIINVQSNESRSAESILLLERFAKVFEQTYTRFLDLQKAEAQTRESHIQLALERVRARSMAMYNSQELHEVADVLFQQLLNFGSNVLNAGIALCKPDADEDEFWVSSDTGIRPLISIPHTEDATQKNLYEGWKNKLEFYTESKGGEELKAHYHYLASVPSLKPFFQEGISNRSLPTWQKWHAAYFSHGYVFLMTTDEYDEEKILVRFAKTFEQAYTRFLDLQKVEAQVREAQIEASLEKVRSRSLAMHKSDELKEAGELLWNELARLGIESLSSGYVLMDKEEKIGWIYAPNPATGKIAEPMGCMHTETKEMLKVLSYWKKQEPFSIVEMNEQETIAHQTFIAEKSLATDGTIIHWITAEQLIALSPKRLFLHNFNFKQGYLMIVGGNRLNEKQIELMLRFTKVFQQTYTRFLDLQKAEAQARESQIEAALERVRSRSMGMQKSEELKEVIKVVYDQFVHLNINVDHAGFVVDYIPRGDWHFWIADKNDIPSKITHPYFESVWANQFEEAKQKGSDFFVTNLNFEEKNKFYNELLSYVPGLPEESKNFYFSCPGLAVATVLSENVSLYIENFSGIPYSEEEIKIQMRFGKVFQQTFTRFLDLQKAEAQSRESQIELSLERVRAKTMAMHNSRDVGETAAVMVDELKKLGIETIRCGIGIMHEPGDMELWTIRIDEKDKTDIIIGWLDMNMHPLLHGAFESWRNKIESYTYELKDEDLLNYYNAINNYPGYPIRYDTTTLPGLIHHNEFHFAEGTLFAFSLQQLTEEQRKIFKRFAGVFGQTYRRYLDLKKAEAQTKEAQIETALERVRSRTLAMQKSDELAETSAVLFKQLIGLGISPNRLYITIVKDENGDAEFWITDEDGSKVSMAYEDNMNNNPTFKKMLDGWKRQKKSLVIDMRDEELKQYFEYLSSIHVPFKGGLAQKRRVQHIAYFSKGFIGMASPDEQPAETLQLLERFAYVFNLTFTRFNDLKIAEAHALQAEHDLVEIKAARKKAEETLAELQATQKQLVQSEKMASLGELTAGIAHEIQNPLNFVNNFSEVSNELIDEMNEELDKGEIEEAKVIANDIKQNLEKINHHGKRADAIVKGMLQHSRSSTSQKELTDINALCDEYLRLSYHGLRAKDNSFNATIKTDFDNTIEKINIIPQEIGRVILNLLTNAFYAVNEKKKSRNTNYQPEVEVETRKEGNRISIAVCDNGNGIPKDIIDKIFQPFFTTKPTGSGTGLGLSLSYDIIKAHGGTIKVETKQNEGSEFIIFLPTKENS